MTQQPQADRAQAKEYYEVFSLRVGERDWLEPNRRHAQLRVLVDDVLGDAKGLDILDVGCGAGVMTSFLTRYGSVTGTDFSTAAIAAAQRIVPEVTFIAGSFEDLPTAKRYDGVMLFDVLEHIAASDRPEFLGQLASLLADDGVLFMSTPHPAYTNYKRAQGNPSLQVIDEEVELADVIAEATAVGLQLVRYHAYDVFGGTPEYHAMGFKLRGAPGQSPVLRDKRVKLPGRRAWRVKNAVRSLRNGRRSVARWFLTGRPPDIKT